MRRHGLLTGSENQRAKAIAADFSKAGIRIARVLIAIVFLLNAVGIIDQLRPVQEMIARGIPVTVAPLAAWSGRIVELITRKFIRDLKKELQPGTSGLVLLGSSDPERRQKIEERMQGFGGTVFESNLPPELQEEIESEIERQKAAQRATAPGR